MAKEDFCFTYYDGDATRDMAHMNRLERGAYSDIIISQRKFGRLTLDQIKKILGRDFIECWGAIELIMSIEEEKYFIAWLENSIVTSKSNAQKNKERIKEYWKNKKEVGNTNVIPNSNLEEQYKEEPLENENENENENEDGNGIEKENGSFGKSENLLTEKLLVPEMLKTFKKFNPS